MKTIKKNNAKTLQPDLGDDSFIMMMRVRNKDYMNDDPRFSDTAMDSRRKKALTAMKRRFEKKWK